ncbi:MAG: hypothetical protein E6R04_03645 [Spirochaetes bacterium]|nr:MAG: hypothetical protein E6R04_03645 [Spirochaetota bacterium]
MPEVVPIYAPAVSGILRSNLRLKSTVRITQDNKFRVVVNLEGDSELGKEIITLMNSRGYLASAGEKIIAIYRPVPEPEPGIPPKKRRTPRPRSVVGGSRDRN